MALTKPPGTYRHLSSKETPELVGGFQHGTVSGNVGLRRQSVVRLSSRQRAGNAVHGKDGGLLVLQLLDELFVLLGIDEGNQRLVSQRGGLLGRRRTKLVVPTNT